METKLKAKMAENRSVQDSNLYDLIKRFLKRF